MVERQRVIDEVRHLFADRLEELERRLRVIDESALEASSGEVIEGFEAPLRTTRHQLVEEGAAGLRKLAEGRDAEITESEQIGLEAIVALEGRPAIFVQNDDFADPPAEWVSLTEHRAQIRESTRRVGRVEVSGHLNYEWVGTGSLIGPQTVITNRHVAVEFANATEDGIWTFRSGMGSRIDFREEYGSLQPLEFDVAEVIGVHELHDLALLRVAASSSIGSSLPEPLSVAASPPDPVVSRKVYVIGYPAWDGRRNDPRYMKQIFLDIYDVKRLQPGEVRSGAGTEPEFIHDCSTLGGNSGSPVFDLSSHQVIGLHFGGRYLEGNHAVALWTLGDDDLLARGRANFTEGL
jgi:hypothetical protein